MKKLLALLLLGLGTANAGLITHTDYTDGNTITAAGQNTNENTIVNEVNGNLNSDNLLDGGVSTADIADNAITNAKLATVVQSSITAFAQYASYRRPNLQWISVQLIDIENNTGTSNETCIIFQDGQRRCVTENTSSTTQYRRWDIGAACNFRTGTEDSGLSGASEAANTWYSLYAIKSLVSASNFVICASTRTPTQGNYSSLNTMYETGGWQYLGEVRNGGDGTNSTTELINFTQNGPLTYFTTANNGGSGGLVAAGIRFADTAGATTLTYTYASGTGNAEIPGHLSMAYYFTQNASVAGTAVVRNAADTIGYFTNHSNTAAALRYHWAPSAQGVKLSNGPGSSIGYDIGLAGFYDSVLASGMNPLL